jgi:hypothetical protein
VALATGVPGFVGFAKPVPPEGPVPLRRKHELAGNFILPDDGFLRNAVAAFFDNGGERCYVVVTAGRDAAALEAAIDRLTSVADLDLIVVPDAMALPDHEAIRVQRHAVAHCEAQGDRFAILDALPARDVCALLDQREKILHGRTGPVSAALYYPWLQLPRASPVSSPPVSSPPVSSPPVASPPVSSPPVSSPPVSSPPVSSPPVSSPPVSSPPVSSPPVSSPPVASPPVASPPVASPPGKLLPPSGAVAGVFARTDARVGVHKAPANEEVAGVLDLHPDVDTAIQDRLNPQGINCLRAFPGRGVRVWGARTISRDPAWRYVNVRRLVITLRRWIALNLSWAGFEPNGPLLWVRIERELRGHLTALWRAGALSGDTADAAFYIKCDSETNPPERRGSGEVVTEIGLAPNPPAEFVVIRVAQREGAAELLAR